MRRLAPAAAAVLAVVVAGAAVLLYRKGLSRDVRGSSTVEYTTTAVLSGPASSARTIVWPMFGYGVERLHEAPPTRLRPPFRTTWTAGGRSLLEFPPAIAYGRLFLANGSGDLLAVSTRTGARAWRYRSGRCVAASPAVGRLDGGTVYETFLGPKPCSARHANDGEVVAVSTGTGRLRWRVRTGASETSPLLFGRLVYVGDWLGTIHCLSAASGRTLWTFHAGGAVKGGLAEYRNAVYFGSYDGRVYALDAVTGGLLWRASGDPRLFGGHGTFYSTPAVAYGRVYIGSTDGKVYSFGATSGKRRWSFSTGGYVYGSPAVWRQRVFIGSYGHEFYALDAATGEKLWSFRAKGPISGSATVVDGVVYFATLAGETYGLDAVTGRLLWTFPEGRYTPVVTDGRRLYLLGYAKIYGLAPR